MLVFAIPEFAFFEKSLFFERLITIAQSILYVWIEIPI